jgi:GH25 family lysozyme M1 (1,4-beta-N-acetylmuramidase)
LKNYGFGGNIIIWLEHYLQDRFQRVVINGCYTSWQYLNAGVPQGYILDPPTNWLIAESPVVKPD